MVLTSFLRKGSYAIAFLSVAPVRADELKDIFRYKVSDSDCAVRFKRQNSWAIFPYKIPVGTEVVGKPSPSAQEVIVFKTKAYPSTVLAAKKSCMFKGESVNVFEGVKKKYQVYLSALSWQESLNFKYIDGRQTPLRATSIGPCIGGNYLKVRDDIEYGWGGCVFLAKAQVGNAAVPDALSAKYLAHNVDVFGTLAYPAFYWRPKSGSVAFGGSLPLMVRYGRWPIAESVLESVSIGPKVWFLMGLLVETRFEAGPLHFSQKIGFFNLPKSLTWALESGYTF